MKNPEMDDTLLIFRMERPAALARTVDLHLPSGALTKGILDNRRGEAAALGASDMGGVWMCLAVGTLTDYSIDGDRIQVRIEDVELRQPPLTIVTDDRWASNVAAAPNAVDVIRYSDLAPAMAPAFYEQSGSRTLAAAESDLAMNAAGVGYRGQALKPREQDWFVRIAEAYDWQCAISLTRQTSRDGLAHEGVVIRLDPSAQEQDADVCQWMFVSETIAWYYRHGLLAIGDEYDVVRHPDLNAGARLGLDISSPRALLGLPKDRALWPDSDAMRRHRLNWGL